MCATDLLVEGELTPPNKLPENTVVIPDSIMRAFERCNQNYISCNLKPVTLEAFVINGVMQYLIHSRQV